MALLFLEHVMNKQDVTDERCERDSVVDNDDVPRQPEAERASARAEGRDCGVARERGWAAFAEAPASVAEAGRRPGPTSHKNVDEPGYGYGV